MAKILIVDDDRLVRETAQTIFRAKGHEVTAVADGTSGIQAARHGAFDVVIVDVFMPGVDGLQVIGAIREAHPRLPMIAASGFMFGGDCPAMPNFDAMAHEAGATATLYKPFRADELLRAIESALAAAV